jgi:hypothetical protein
MLASLAPDSLSPVLSHRLPVCSTGAWEPQERQRVLA